MGSAAATLSATDGTAILRRAAAPRPALPRRASLSARIEAADYCSWPCHSPEITRLSHRWIEESLNNLQNWCILVVTSMRRGSQWLTWT